MRRDPAGFGGILPETNVIPLWQRNDPSAYRPQPDRDGPDFWPTIDPHLILTLAHFVLPTLPPGVPIWEAAAGAGHLVDPLRQARREVFASDLFPGRADIVQHDFVHGLLLPETRDTVMMTNPPNSQLDAFMVRGLSLIDAGHLAGLVLLVRNAHDATQGRAAAFNRALCEWRCCWRPYWKPRRTGDKQPRWTYQWHAWLRGRTGPPVTVRLTRADVEQLRLDLMPPHRKAGHVL
jgi:hypothetical protein